MFLALLAAAAVQLPDLQHVQGWLESGGYVVLFSLLFFCGLGLPVPEDLPLITAGILIAQHHMHLAIAAPVAWLGILGGDCCLYYFGHKYGHNITRAPLIGRHVTLARLERVERWFERYGILVVAVGRLFAGIRGAMVIAAGAARYNFAKFIVADGIAALFSGACFVGLGWWLGSNLDLLEHRVKEFKFALAGFGVVAAIAFVAYLLLRQRSATAGSTAGVAVGMPADPAPRGDAATQSGGVAPPSALAPAAELQAEPVRGASPANGPVAGPFP